MYFCMRSWILTCIFSIHFLLRCRIEFVPAPTYILNIFLTDSIRVFSPCILTCKFFKLKTIWTLKNSLHIICIKRHVTNLAKTKNLSVQNQTVLTIKNHLHANLFLEFPFLATHGALLLSLRIQPFHYAVNMKTMRTLAPNQWTIVARKLAIGTAGVERHSTNSARVVVGYPMPRGHRPPTFDSDLQIRTAAGRCGGIHCGNLGLDIVGIIFVDRRGHFGCSLLNGIGNWCR